MTTICGAKNRQGEPCRVAPMPNGRCHRHGGATPGGIGSPHLKHGRYSRYLPERLLGRYEEALSDRELLGLRDDIALLQARIDQKLADLDTGESEAAWTVLASQVGALAAHWGTGDRDGVQHAVHAMQQTLERGLGEARAFEEIGALMRQKAALAKQEQARMVLLKQMISAEEALAMIAAITAIVREVVGDRDKMRIIHRRFLEVMGAGER